MEHINALWGADAKLTSVPVWYSRPCFFNGKVADGCLDFSGEETVYVDGDAVAYFANKEMGGLKNGSVYYLTAKGEGLFEIAETRGGAPIKVTSKKGVHLFVKVEQEAEVNGKPMPVMMPVDVELAKCKINGMVSPGWYRLMTFTTSGGVKRVKTELVVSLRSMKLAEGKEVSLESSDLMGADGVIKQTGVDVTIKGGVVPQPEKLTTVKLQARTADVEGISVDSRGFWIESELNATVKDAVFGGTTTGVMIPSGEGVTQVKHGDRAFTANCTGVVEIKDCKFTGKTYNFINIGDMNATSTAPRKVVIENVDFSGECTNNAISLYTWADGAELVIRNCHFAKVSNMLRLGDKKGGKLSVKIVDCTVDQWDKNADYAAAVICQDQGNSAELKEVLARHIFSDVTIDFVNFSYQGKKIMELRPEGHTQDVVYVHGAGAIRTEPELKPTVTFA